MQVNRFTINRPASFRGYDNFQVQLLTGLWLKGIFLTTVLDQML